jgi:hypothetical protein
VHLDELKKYNKRGSGDPFERAHHESFLFHLLGTIDAFLQELNIHYKCHLPPKKVNRNILEAKLKKMVMKSAELEELSTLIEDHTSWLSLAKELRDHATHRHHIGRKFFIGGSDKDKVYFRNPKSGEDIESDIVEMFDLWHKKMFNMIERLRKSLCMAQ